MSGLSAIIAPPKAVRGRAWECAFVLAEEYPDRLLDDRRGGDAGGVLRRGPERLNWDEAAAMFRLFGRLVERRT